MARQPEVVTTHRKEVGEFLSALLRAAGVTTAELAKATHRDRSSISHICAGRQFPGKAFWQSADAYLGAGGRLVLAYEKAVDVERAERKAELERELFEVRGHGKPAVDPVRIAHE
ncbi:helix-turn-helix domain-containing protein [Actinosynnema sp. NPDC059335]|uniref:helix-turn-helix domain-containing protein n=1 Tax=Actinosynnema sp. NPDC059335 TaxID=3346804 RepID=UPI00366BBEFA